MLFRSIAFLTLTFVLLMFSGNVLGAGYEIEELVAQESSEGSIYVQGTVRNKSKGPIKGYVVVQFMKDEAVVQAVEAHVNKGRSVPAGKTWSFEMVARPDVTQVFDQVSVDFVESKRR